LVKTFETLFNQSLSVTLEIKQTWGSDSTSLEGSHFFNDVFVDFSKYRVELFSELSLRVFNKSNPHLMRARLESGLL